MNGKTVSFTVKIKEAKAKVTRNIHGSLCVHVGIEPTPYFPKVKECGRNEHARTRRERQTF